MAFSYRPGIGAVLSAALVSMPLAPALAQVPVTQTAPGAPMTVQQLAAAIVQAVTALGPRATNAQIRAVIKRLIAQALASGMSVADVGAALALASESFPAGTAGASALAAINADLAGFIEEAAGSSPDAVPPGGTNDNNTVGGPGPDNTVTGNDYRPPQ